MHDPLVNLGESELLICSIFDGKGLLLYGNKLYQRLFRGTMGEDWLKFVWPADAHKVESLCLKAKQHPGNLFGTTIKAFTTGHLWAMFAFELYLRDDGNIGVVGVKLPDDVSASQLEADQLRAQLREIAFIQSHEFRPPVARILGLSNMAASSTDMEEIKRYALLMKSSAEEIDKFIHEITTRTKTDK